VGVQVNCEIPWEHVPYLSASAVVIHYEEVLYQMHESFNSVEVLHSSKGYSGALRFRRSSLGVA